MFFLARMMYPMRLRRHHNVAKKTEIGFDVAMIKPGIPGSKDIPAGEGCQGNIRPQNQERNKTHSGLDQPLYGMDP